MKLSTYKVHGVQRDAATGLFSCLMKHTCGLITIILLVSCTVRGPTTVRHGQSEVTIAANAALGANTFQRIALNKNGTFSITTRDDGEAVAGKALDVAGLAYGGYLMAGVQEAKDAADASVAIGAQKAAIQQAATSASVETARIGAGVETTRILNPVP